MRSLIGVLPFVALTFICWGNYGVLMHNGQHSMHGSLYPFIFVGLAYFLIAVVVPVAALATRGETGAWTMNGTVWSLSAGAAGAVGALGIILAFKNGGKPVYVMPLVFGCAPVVNTFVTMLMARTWKEANAVFMGGIIVVALGAAGVLVFKPGAESSGAVSELTVAEFALVLLWIGVTALTWGSYGPVLHKGQMKMKGSRLRPFMCVGIAYFAIAVVVPIVLLSSAPSLENSQFTVGGSLWSLGAGAAGALGALGIIMAFNFGGKPIFVMPLVFGCAPVVNTFTTLGVQYWELGEIGEINILFLIALAMVIAGAVTVLIFAPKPHPPKAAAGKSEKQPADKSSTAKDAGAKPAPAET